MPRQRCPDSKRAETLFRKGMKLAEIADRLGVPASTVRRWKKDQNWEARRNEKCSETETETERKPNTKTERKPNANRTETKGRRGAPKGNVNAVGNRSGGPVGNQYGWKHGAYAKVYADVLTPDEMALAGESQRDEEELLEEQIFLFTIRERRILRAINMCTGRDPNTGLDDPLLVNTVMKVEHQRVFEGTPEEQAEQRELYEAMVQHKIDAGERMPGKDVVVTTNTEHKSERVMRMEKELTSIQSQKTKAINALAQLRLARQKVDGGNDNDIVRAWADAIASARGKKDE